MNFKEQLTNLILSGGKSIQLISNENVYKIDMWFRKDEDIIQLYNKTQKDYIYELSLENISEIKKVGYKKYAVVYSNNNSIELKFSSKAIN